MRGDVVRVGELSRTQEGEGAWSAMSNAAEGQAE